MLINQPHPLACLAACASRKIFGKMSGLKLYTDTISPVCRSVMLLLAANGIPYEKVEVSLIKREPPTNAALAAINPTKKIPALDDNGFTFFESNAILRYLAQKYSVPDHWYPKDLRRRAKIDEAIVWFHGGLRCGAFFWGCVMPKRTGERNEAKIAETKANLKNALDVIENYFLKDKKFVGGDEISIADLQFLGETTQYWLAGMDIYKGRPNMERWMEECRKVLTPHFDQIYQKIYEVREAGHFSGFVIE